MYDDEVLSRGVEVSGINEDQKLLYGNLKQDLYTGCGFNSLLSDIPSVFSLDFVSLCDQDLVVVDACLAGLGNTVRSRVDMCLRDTRMGTAVLYESSDSKIQLLTHIATTMIFNSNIGKVFCSAPTHADTGDLAARLDVTCEKALRRLDKGHRQRYVRVVIRGLQSEVEAQNFIKFGRTKVAPLSGPFPHLSAAYWLWETIKCRQTKRLSPRLLALRTQSDQDPKYTGLLLWALSSPDDTDVEPMLIGDNWQDIVNSLLEQVVMVCQITPSQSPFIRGKYWQMMVMIRRRMLCAPPHTCLGSLGIKASTTGLPGAWL